MMTLIKIKADAQTREAYVHNILMAWYRATPEQETHGRKWYLQAHEFASQLSSDVRKGAGVLAAFSANKSWTENQRLARDAFAGHVHGHWGDALRKVETILAGKDPESVLPMTRKTGQFYRCILDPWDGDAVVIDRHAHDIAVGELYGEKDRGLSAIGRYALLADCYREAAHRLNEQPSVVQAVTWLSHASAF